MYRVAPKRRRLSSESCNCPSYPLSNVGEKFEEQVQHAESFRGNGCVARSRDYSAARRAWPSARSTRGLTSLIISSIERIAALGGVAPTLNEKHMWTGWVARISPTSFSATVSTSPISRSLWICSSGGSSGNGLYRRAEVSPSAIERGWGRSGRQSRNEEHRLKGVRFAEDSPVEGAGFEPSVPPWGRTRI